jgi:hypothetical protein
MVALASVVKRGVADESGNEKAREQVEGERERDSRSFYSFMHTG